MRNKYHLFLFKRFACSHNTGIRLWVCACVSLGVPAYRCPCCHVIVCVYMCACIWGSLPALIKHNISVALETAFLPWHSWGQGGVAGCDMILCGLWFSQGCGGSRALVSFSLVCEYTLLMWDNKCGNVSFKEVMKPSCEGRSGKLSQWAM